jgi:hypothetical protein
MKGFGCVPCMMSTFILCFLCFRGSMGAGSSHERAWLSHWAALSRKAHGVQRKVMKQVKAEMKHKGAQPSMARIQVSSVPHDPACPCALLTVRWCAGDHSRREQEVPICARAAASHTLGSLYAALLPASNSQPDSPIASTRPLSLLR